LIQIDESHILDEINNWILLEAHNEYKNLKEGVEIVIKNETVVLEKIQPSQRQNRIALLIRY
jgi:hypothetical protein